MKEFPNCQFYCLSFNNEERKNNMIRRFNNFEVDYKFYDGITSFKVVKNSHFCNIIII
jgi:hypothetical protein